MADLVSECGFACTQTVGNAFIRSDIICEAPTLSIFSERINAFPTNHHNLTKNTVLKIKLNLQKTKYLNQHNGGHYV